MSGSVHYSLCENTPERLKFLLADFILCAECSVCVERDMGMGEGRLGMRKGEAGWSPVG